MTHSSPPFNGIPVLNDGFVGLVDHMGDDSSIVQAARISYGKDEREIQQSTELGDNLRDRNLIRYLMRHRHTTPFEMVEFKFIVRVPMDCWRQWIRHRTASVNEYSTRYTEAIDSCQTTDPNEWRLQSKSNKQGSAEGELTWPTEDYWKSPTQESRWLLGEDTIGHILSTHEEHYHVAAQDLYQTRLNAGVAREQARKDLPLSTYTEAYWKINLHNLLHFLSLRMDSHAQYEIRSYANAIYKLIQPVVPVTCQAFEDYRLNACTFSAQEMELLKEYLNKDSGALRGTKIATIEKPKPDSLSDREWKEFKEKLNV